MNDFAGSLALDPVAIATAVLAADAKATVRIALPINANGPARGYSVNSIYRRRRQGINIPNRNAKSTSESLKS